MGSLFLTGDISGGDWARLEFEVTPWDDPEYYREISPLTYARDIRTPLLIQHSERDLRTTIGQAEALFTVLRSLRRPVRLLRVPEDNHELTRSGTPFRRIENLEVVLGWFRHFLVEGKRGLPPLPQGPRRPLGLVVVRDLARGFEPSVRDERPDQHRDPEQGEDHGRRVAVGRLGRGRGVGRAPGSRRPRPARRSSRSSARGSCSGRGMCPLSSNVTDADAPSAMLPVSNEPPSAVAVWATPLVLSQVTVSPTLTVVVGGKAKSAIGIVASAARTAGTAIRARIRRRHRESDRPPHGTAHGRPSAPSHPSTRREARSHPTIRSRVAGRFSSGAGVSSRSHDDDATSRQPRPRACQRADRGLGRPPGTARQPAGAGHAGRPGRRRGPGRRAQAPVDQEGLEDVGARPLDPDDGSDHARGEGHARQGPGDVRQGDAAAAGRPDDPVRRGGLRLPGARRRGEGRAQGLEREGRLGRHGLPVRPDVPRHQDHRDAGGGRGGRRRGRHGHRPRGVPRGRLPDGVRGDRRGQGGGRARRTSRSSSRPASSRPTTTSGGRACSRWRPARTSSRPRPAR